MEFKFNVGDEVHHIDIEKTVVGVIKQQCTLSEIVGKEIKEGETYEDYTPDIPWYIIEWNDLKDDINGYTGESNEVEYVLELKSPDVPLLEIDWK